MNNYNNNENLVFKLTFICSIYFILKYGFNLFIPILTIIIFQIIHDFYKYNQNTINKYIYIDYNIDINNYQEYNIINNFDMTKYNVKSIRFFTLLTLIIAFNKILSIQILITFFLFWLKYDLYKFTIINQEDYILIKSKISVLIGIICLIIMTHYEQIFNNNYLLNIIIVLCQNIMYITYFEIEYLN